MAFIVGENRSTSLVDLSHGGWAPAITALACACLRRLRGPSLCRRTSGKVSKPTRCRALRLGAPRSGLLSHLLCFACTWPSMAFGGRPSTSSGQAQRVAERLSAVSALFGESVTDDDNVSRLVLGAPGAAWGRPSTSSGQAPHAAERLSNKAPFKQSAFQTSAF
jgi:hypothetical protein